LYLVTATGEYVYKYKDNEHVFVLKLLPGQDGVYYVDLKTEKYWYALLGGTDRAKYASSLRTVVETIDSTENTLNRRIKILVFNHSNSSYTKQDVDDVRNFLLNQLNDEQKLQKSFGPHWRNAISRQSNPKEIFRAAFDILEGSNLGNYPLKGRLTNILVNDQGRMYMVVRYMFLLESIKKEFEGEIKSGDVTLESAGTTLRVYIGKQKKVIEPDY
jgi:hypothetical protein